MILQVIESGIFFNSHFIHIELSVDLDLEGMAAARRVGIAACQFSAFKGKIDSNVKALSTQVSDHQFEERWPYLWEMLEAMQALWTQEEASYHGKYIQFERAWSYPKPVQHPHPPILLGVYDSKVGRARVARRAQGWLPSSYDLERTERSIADVRQRMKANNRDPDQLTTSILYLSEEPSEDAVLRALQCGADRLILRVPTKNEKLVLKFMDRFQSHTG